MFLFRARRRRADDSDRAAAVRHATVDLVGRLRVGGHESASQQLRHDPYDKNSGLRM